MSATFRRRTSLIALMLHMAGIGLSLGLLFPLTSLTLESWGTDDWVIGLAAAMAPVAVLLLMPWLPMLVSHLGAVRAMGLGCTVAALGIVGMYCFQSVPAWMICRFAIGAGFALPWLTGDVWVNTVASEQHRGKAVGAYIIFFSTGIASGPLLLEWIGIDGFAAYAAGVGALLLALLPLLAVARFAPPITVAGGEGVLGSMTAAPVVAIGALTAGFTESAAFALLPVWGLEIGLADSAALRVLSIFVIGGIVLQLGTGAVADRVGRRSLLAGVGMGLAVVTVGLHVSSGVVTFVLAFVAGGLTLAVYALSLTLLGQRFAPAELANASAAYLVLYQLGSMSGPVITGVAMQFAGPVGFPAALGLAGLACGVVALTGRQAEQPGRD